MRQQNVIIFSSGKNKCVAHAIAWGLDGGVCKPTGGWLQVIDLPTTLLASQKTAQKILDIKADDAIEKDHLSRLLAKEIDLFRNTLVQFLVNGKNGSYHATVTDAECVANTIFIDEFTFDGLMK